MALTFETLSLRDIQIGFDPELVLAAFELLQGDAIAGVELESLDRLTGYVIENRKRYRVALTLVNDSLNMGCECGRLKLGPCVHVVALLLAWTSEADMDDEDDPDDILFLEDFAPQGPVPPAAGRNTPPQIFPSPSLQEIRADWEKRLENRTVKDMRELAAAWGVKLRGTLRDQVYTGLLELISAPETLPRVLSRLSTDAGRVLDLLCALHDTAPDFRWSQVAPYLQAALASVPQARPLEECRRELEQAGLIFQSSYANAYMLPLQVLAMPRVNPALFKPWSGDPPQVQLAQPFHFTRLVLRLLLLAQGGRLHRAAPAHQKGNKDAWPRKSAPEKETKEIEIIPEPGELESGLRAAMAHALALPPEALDLAARLLEVGGLWPAPAAKSADEKLPSWLQIPPQNQSRRLFALAAMLPTQLELDLARSTGISVWRTGRDLRYRDFLNVLGLARLRLVRLLARLPQGQWFEIDSILRCMHALQPGWLPEFSSRQESPVATRIWDNAPIWVNLNRRKINPMDYEDWSKGYAPFYRAILTQSMPWLGLLDVGSQAGRPVAVRLSEFGEFLVGRRADFPLQEGKSDAPPLALNAAGVLTLDLDNAPLPLVNLVVQIGRPETTADSALGPSRLPYRLDDTLLGETFEAGWTLETLVERLQVGLHAPLPNALRARLERIWDRFGRLQIYEDMTLIELADDYALPELLAATSLSQILLHTFSPRLVAVRSAGAEKFIAELQEKGYTPRVEGSAHG